MEKSEPRPGPAAPPEAAGGPSSLTADWPLLPLRPLPAHEAHLYFMRLDGLDEPPPLLYGLLNPEEQERCDRYVFMLRREELPDAA